MERKQSQRVTTNNTHKSTQRSMFKDYPDVLDVTEMSRILQVSVKTAYRLLRDGCIEHLKIGREYRIPKVYVIRYLMSSEGR